MEQRRDMPESRRLDDQGFQEHSRYDRDFQSPKEYFHTRHVEEDPKSLRLSRGPEGPEYQWDPYREGSAGRSEERVARHPDDRRGYRGKQAVLSYWCRFFLLLVLIAETLLTWFL